MNLIGLNFDIVFVLQMFSIDMFDVNNILYKIKTNITYYLNEFAENV